MDKEYNIKLMKIREQELSDKYEKLNNAVIALEQAYEDYSDAMPVCPDCKCKRFGINVWYDGTGDLRVDCMECLIAYLER